MNKKISIFISILLISQAVYAQNNVGIGTTTPNSSAVLDLEATDKGFLPPRMTTVLRDLIANPATGLMIYNSTSARYEYYNGSAWVQFKGLSSVGLSAPTELTVTNSPLTADGTLNLGWASQNQNLIFASPNGAAGTPAFRALVSNDIPNIDAAKITSGIIPVAQGGTGAATLTGMLKGNGTGAITAVTNNPGNVTFWSDANSIGGSDKFKYDVANDVLAVDGSYRLTPLNSAPATPAKGQVYFDNTENKFKYYNGTAWTDFGGSGTLPVGTNNQTIRNNSGSWESTSLLRVSATNVAIGEATFTPATLLHSDAGNNTASYHKFTAGTTTNQTATDGFNVGIDGSGFAIVNQLEDKPIILSTNNLERMRINDGFGGAKITVSGTTSQVNALNVHNTGSTSVAMSITNNAIGNTTTDGLQIGIDGSGHAELRQKENLNLTLFTNDAQRLTILADGKVGIGETSPGVKLHVGGAIALKSADETNSNITVGDRSYIKISSATTISLFGGVTGQILTLQKTGAGSATLLDDSSAKLTGNWVGDIDDTITLIFDGSAWVEISRSINN